ncbi:MAG: hypothetical protein WAM60_12375, partial [Candidatus Promineifilaceae bacterium]
MLTNNQPPSPPSTDGPFTIHYSPFTIHHSLFTILFLFLLTACNDFQNPLAAPTLTPPPPTFTPEPTPT